MLQEDILRENYALMADEQLLNLASTEGKAITPAALQILKEEFERRHLDTGIFDRINANKLTQREQQSAKTKEVYRQLYAQMTKEQLLQLAQDTSAFQHPESLAALHEEFLYRDMDPAAFDNAVAMQQAEASPALTAQENITDPATDEQLWNDILEEKGAGTSNKEIYELLLEKGISEPLARYYTSAITTKAKERYATYEAQMANGGIALAIGLGLTIFTYSFAANGGMFILAWGPIIFGAYRFFNGMYKKDQYKTILEVIEAENKESSIPVTENI